MNRKKILEKKTIKNAPLLVKLKGLGLKINPVILCFGSLKNIWYTVQEHKLKAKSNLIRETHFFLMIHEKEIVMSHTSCTEKSQNPCIFEPTEQMEIQKLLS